MKPAQYKAMEERRAVLAEQVASGEEMVEAQMDLVGKRPRGKGADA